MIDSKQITGTARQQWDDAYLISIGTNRIVQGNATYSGTGLTFDVTNGIYYIVGTRYTANAGQTTLAAADPTNPRIDVIYYDNTGNYGVLTGTPGVNPAKPVVDPATQIELTSVLIPAGATTPIITGNTTVYNENIEFTGTSNNGTINFANTTAPAVGSKHISVGAFTNNQFIYFNDVTTHDASTYQYLKYRHRLNATFNVNSFFSIYFANGAAPVSNQVTVTNGNFGYVRTSTGSYQIITIPMSAFVFSSTTFNRIYFVMKGSNATGFYLDMIELQGGVTIPPTNGVQSFNTRTGNVIPQSGDYTVGQITGALSSVLATNSVFVGNGSNVATATALSALTFTESQITGLVSDLGAKQATLTGAQGDILYFSALNTLSNLSKNTTATRYLSNTGTSNAPAWAQINLTNGVTGALPIANGGTNNAALDVTQGNVYYGDGSKLVALAPGTSGRFLKTQGAGANPIWADATAALTATQIGFGDGSNLLSGSANLTYASSAITIINAGIGVTTTSGLILSNTIAAAAGVQQNSPALRFAGFGWKTTATAASQSVTFDLDVLPIQGTSAPTGNFRIVPRVNNITGFASYTFGTSGAMVINGINTGSDGLTISGGSLGIQNTATQTALITLGNSGNSAAYVNWIISTGNVKSTTGFTGYQSNMPTGTLTSLSGTYQNFQATATYGGQLITAAPTVIYGYSTNISYSNLNASAVVFPLQVGYDNLFVLGTGVAKNITEVYGFRASLNAGDVNPTGKIVTYAAFKAVDVSTNYVSTNAYGFWQEGTFLLNRFDANTSIGTAAKPGATARLVIGAGTTTIAPLLLTSGTNNTTAQAGAFEYDGTNLFFTRTGTTRETNFCGNAGAAAPSTSVLTAFTNYYGTGGTVALSAPNSWASVNIGGTAYKIPLYT